MVWHIIFHIIYMSANFTRAIVGFIIIVLFSCCSGDRLPATSTVTPLSYGINPADTFVYTLKPVESNISPLEKRTIRDAMINFLDTLTAENYIKDRVNRIDILQELKNFYTFNNYDLVWSSTTSPLPKSQLMLNHLLTADAQGLHVEDYDVTKLLNYQSSIFSNKFNLNLVQLILLDIRLSTAYVSYAWHLSNGRTSPDIVVARWLNDRHKAPVAKILAENTITKAMELLTPKHHHYKPLIKALELYRSIEHHGKWEELPQKIKLQNGDKNTLVPRLRSRLVATRDLNITEKEIAADSVFDDALQNAVKRFQFRHGLTVDGVVGKETIVALNTPIQERIAQIILNLERIRWMPPEMGEKYIYVNIPEYQLYVHENDEPALSMKVIVGKKKNATPIFKETLKYVVFSPSWNVPKSIIHKEILPKMQQDTSFLSRGGYKIYQGRGDDASLIEPTSIDWSTASQNEWSVVQQPGPGNALGRSRLPFCKRLTSLQPWLRKTGVPRITS